MIICAFVGAPQAVTTPDSLPATGLSSVFGQPRHTSVGRGASLYRMARRLDLGLPAVLRANGLASPHLSRPSVLLLPTMHLVPVAPAEGVVLNIAERRLYVFSGGQLIDSHAVAVGKTSTPTAIGRFHIAERKKNPTWIPPQSLVDNEGVKDEPVPPGAVNPLGDRWMGWSMPGFGFHSTNAPASVGNAVSHGCVRLYPERARVMFDEVRVGMPIYAVYAPAQIGVRDGVYYLSVCPDIYGSGQASVASIEKRLQALGLLPFTDRDQVARIAAQRDMTPHAIAGETLAVTVNGVPLSESLRVFHVHGLWVVPARPIVQALGGTVAPGDDGAATINLKARTLMLQPGALTAESGTEPIQMPLAAGRLNGVLYVPLQTLVRAFGLSVQETGPGEMNLDLPASALEPAAP